MSLRRAAESMEVERTIGWISLARIFEQHVRIAAAFVRMAIIRIVRWRLAARPSACTRLPEWTLRPLVVTLWTG
jgi:hypothetical protein